MGHIKNSWIELLFFYETLPVLHHSCIGRNSLNWTLLLTINTGWPCSCCTGNLSFFTCTASCLSGYSPSGLTAISVQSNNLTCTCSQLTWKKNQQQVPESLNALQAIYYSQIESWPYVTADTPQQMGSQLMDITKWDNTQFFYVVDIWIPCKQVLSENDYCSIKARGLRLHRLLSVMLAK